MSEQRNPPVTVKNEENPCVDDSVPLKYAGRDHIVKCFHYMRESNSNSDPETRRCRFTEREKRRRKKYLPASANCLHDLAAYLLLVAQHSQQEAERETREREKNVI